MDAERVKQVTVEDLMSMGGEARVEVVCGEIIEMSPSGTLHHWIAANMQRLLNQLVDQDQGMVFPDGLIFLLDKGTAGIKGARVPDVAYVRRDDFPEQWDIEKPFPGAPTLAVEVMSPNDSTQETLERVRDYLTAGSTEVWVVYPRQQELHRYQSADLSAVAVYREDDVLTFEALEIRTSALFVLPDWLPQK